MKECTCMVGWIEEYVDEHVDEMIEGKKSWKDKGMNGWIEEWVDY